MLLARPAGNRTVTDTAVRAARYTAGGEVEPPAGVDYVVPLAF